MIGVLLGLVVACGTGSVHSTTPTNPPAKPSSKATKISWVPSLTDVKQATFTLNAYVGLIDIQMTGPIQIYPTSQKGKALIKKILHLLAQGKAIAMSPGGTPLYGTHELVVHLKAGNTLDVSQWYGSTPEQASSSIIDVSSATNPTGGRYEDPALAQWLADGWSKDTQAISEGWTCGGKSPPNGDPNQISGTFKSGQAWEFAASSQAGCVMFYTRKHGTWTSVIVTEHEPLGATIEQAQFVDATHGFVLVGGSPGAGQLPRVLYETSDGGATWHALPNSGPFPMSDTNVQMRFTSPADGWLTTLNSVYSPARVYVYHTTDGGKIWTGTYFALPPAVEQYASDLSVASPRVAQGRFLESIVVFGQGALFLFDSNDGGSNWQYAPYNGP